MFLVLLPDKRWICLVLEVDQQVVRAAPHMEELRHLEFQTGQVGQELPWLQEMVDVLLHGVLHQQEHLLGKEALPMGVHSAVELLFGNSQAHRRLMVEPVAA